MGRLRTAALAALALAAGVAARGIGDDLAVRVLRVLDGDTVSVAWVGSPLIVRLVGIDAPERDQPGGSEARAALAGLLGGRCSLDMIGRDRWGRTVAGLRVGGGDVGLALIRRGHAWAVRRYLPAGALRRAYLDAEESARAAGRGLWAGGDQAVMPPWDWRRMRRACIPLPSGPARLARVSRFRRPTGAPSQC